MYLTPKKNMNTPYSPLLKVYKFNRFGRDRAVLILLVVLKTSD
jgi:hypothetical protein